MNTPDKDEKSADRGSGMLSALARNDATLASFARFFLIGGGATVVHGVVLYALVTAANIHPTLANVAAFMIAFGVSYIGHYYVSFRSNADHAKAVIRFFATALIGLTLNTLIFLVVVNLLRLHYFLAFAVVVLAVPPLIFTISKKFVFKTTPE